MVSKIDNNESSISRELDEVSISQLKDVAKILRAGKRSTVSTTLLKKWCRENGVKIGGKNLDRVKRLIQFKIIKNEESSLLWENLGLESFSVDDMLDNGITREMMIRAGLKIGESVPLVSLTYVDRNGEYKTLNDNHATRYEKAHLNHNVGRQNLECFFSYKHIKGGLRTMDINSISVCPTEFNRSPLPKIWNDEKYLTTVCLPMVEQNQGLVLAGRQNNSKGYPEYLHWRVGKIMNRRSNFDYYAKQTATAFRGAYVELKLQVDGKARKSSLGRIIPVVYETFASESAYVLGWAIFHDVRGVIPRD